MLKVLILQQLNNLADEKTELMIRDRLTYQRFLSIKCGDRIPDAKTIWTFRNALKTLTIHDKLFAEFTRQLNELGYSAKQGQLIDATFIEAPRQRNTREENAQIKAGETPET
jgi:IS5 family transposase